MLEKDKLHLYKKKRHPFFIFPILGQFYSSPFPSARLHSQSPSRTFEIARAESIRYFIFIFFFNNFFCSVLLYFLVVFSIHIFFFPFFWPSYRKLSLRERERSSSMGLLLLLLLVFSVATADEGIFLLA